MATKNILVMTQNGQSGKTIETTAATKDELIPQLKELNIDVNNMSFVIGETDAELITGSSSLPEGEFTLFLVQKKSKAGSILN